MSGFRFGIVELRDSTPQEWLRVWSDRYAQDDDLEHNDLIARHVSFSADDFERIGKWKDGAKEGRWKANVASVAYSVWKRAAEELPKCPEQGEVADFLDRWCGETYTDVFPNKSVVKHFGLSRATTLLHFVSGGHYPIFDSRVRIAISRLGHSPVQDTVHCYLNSFCPSFFELAVLCGTENDLRRLDKALFSYGAFESILFSNWPTTHPATM